MPSPRSHRRRPAPVDYSVAIRLQALLILLVVHFGLATVRAGRPDDDRRLTGTPVAAAGFAPPVAAPGPSDAASAPSDATSRAPKPAQRPAPPTVKAVAKQAKYLPTGTGMWTYQWSETEGGNTLAVVRRAQQAGLSHIFVRTGTRKGGFDGGRVLNQLLPATKGTGIKVIAWDFPTLHNPEADARRLARAANFRVQGAPRVAAVAPDIETGAEGTKLSGRAVDRYLRTLRSLLPNDVAILTCVPWPSEKRLGKFPYDVVGPLSDGIIPMAYWINRDPGTVAAQSVLRLKKYGKPVMPVGQAYDPRIDVPSLKLAAPTEADVNEFVSVAKRYGARSVSLWVWQFATPAHWKAIQRAKQQFPVSLG